MADLAVLFPGQGSQHVGMGREFAESFPSAREAFEEADDALDFPLSRVAWEGPEDELIKTENAQPAILTHGYAAWTVLRDELTPDVRLAAGHSLGEFTAYAAAGSIPFAEAVRLVRRRGELMAASGAEHPGTMAAVVGLEAEQVAELCERVMGEGGIVVAANYNTPQQVVISGEVPAVERAGSLASEAGARMVKPLAVSGAFHSPLMSSAEAGLRERLKSITLSDPIFPIVSNVSAEPVSDGESARDLLVRQLTSPVRWAESVRFMAGEGVEACVELGPGRVLCGLVRRIDRDLPCIPVSDPEGIDQFREERT